MLLISPKRAAIALGSSCARSDGSGEEQLLEMLRSITPRAEAALNVDSLTRGAFIDTFQIRSPTRARYRSFRLANGFLTTAPITLVGITDGYGDTVSAPSMVDHLNGVVMVDASCIFSEFVQIAYSSGFEVPVRDASIEVDNPVHVEPDYRVLSGVPDALAGIVLTMLTNAYRNSLLIPRAPKEYGFLPTLNEAMRKELAARIYCWYMRPRDGTMFHTTHAPQV